jgi:hypothetical protein
MSIKKHHATTHGMSRTSIYRRWLTMKARCFNKSNRKYSRYGGRGVAVCDRWLSFELFLIDMGQPPGKEFSIDREDVNGNYEPGNCRWATQKTQQNNRVNNRILSFGGESLLISAWAEKTGIPHKIITQRIDRDRWPVERALTEKPHSRKPKQKGDRHD